MKCAFTDHQRAKDWLDLKNVALLYSHLQITQLDFWGENTNYTEGLLGRIYKLQIEQFTNYTIGLFRREKFPKNNNFFRLKFYFSFFYFKRIRNVFQNI